ncbi:MAG: hypothetical protein RMJ67_03435 [Elusimicrobiota bacterium]|nr:hypothetical protein [Endomicrobiia bacterium]MDW8165545.1 hypothetical protein [Elusimicrobiota bacterium]
MNDFLAITNLNIKILLNSIKFATKTEKIRGVFINFIGIIFFISSYIISYEVVIYISTLPVIGSLFVIRILALGFLSSFVMLIFSSIIIPFSTMFESEDFHFLFSLPVKYESIYLNKIMLTILRASWMILVIIIPFTTAFAVVKNFNLLKCLILLLAVLLKILIATTIGIMISILLSYFFPSKKLKNFILVSLIIFLSVVYSVLRFSQPEKLLKPEYFPEVFNYLDFLSQPVAKAFPSWWVVEIFKGLINNDVYLVTINLLKLVISGVIIFILIFNVFRKIFYKCYFLISEKNKTKFYKDKIIKLKSAFFVIATKEIKTLLREPIQWVQFVIVVALSLVYIFNISKLPLDVKYVKITVSFLNLSGIMFILTAIVLRFVFIQPSLEYKTYWLIKSFPLSVKKFFFIKFLVYLPIILLPGLILVITSSLVIGVDRVISFFSLGIILLSCFVLTIAGYSLGILFPKKDYKDIPQIETSFGGLMFVILSFCYIVLCLSSMAELIRKYILGVKILSIEIFFYFLVFFMINFIYAFTPLYYARKKFIEEF